MVLNALGFLLASDNLIVYCKTGKPEISAKNKKFVFFSLIDKEITT